MKMKFLSFFLLISLSFTALNAQIAVESPQGMTPLQLINTTLVLPPEVSGVYISNGKFNNSTAALPTTTASKIGIFTNGFNFPDFPMYRGIIMTTGNISVAPGPNNSVSASSANNDGTTDADLQALTTGNLTGLSKLEFDFMSISGYVQFEYIFASEEYPEYVCSNFNDIFAFFLTGTHPVTGVNSTWNIALIPGTTLPVAINSLNPGVPGTSSGGGGCTGTNQSLAYSSFYQSVPSGSAGMQFDGFTRIPASSPHSPFGIPMGLLAKSRILPCETYHMKLAIANVTDNAYDSGVFLKQGSFITPSEFKTFRSPTVPSNPYLIPGYNSDTVYCMIIPPDSTREYTILAFPDMTETTAEFDVDYEIYYLDAIGDTLVKSDTVVTAFQLGLGQPITKMLVKVKEDAQFDEGEIKVLKLVVKVETCPNAIPIVDTIFYNLRAPNEDEIGIDLYELSSVVIHPNPSDAIFYIKNQGGDPIREIELFDLSGKRVGLYTQIHSAEYQLNLSNLKTGLYFAKLKMDRYHKIVKLVKQ